MDTLAEIVEAKALSIRHSVLTKERDEGPLGMLDMQIAFVSEQLAKARALERRQLSELYNARFYMLAEMHRIYPYNHERRHLLKDRLSAINAERRSLTIQHEREITRLQERLFVLVNQRSLFL